MQLQANWHISVPIFRRLDLRNASEKTWLLAKRLSLPEQVSDWQVATTISHKAMAHLNESGVHNSR